MNSKTHIVTEEEEKLRLDTLLATRFPELSRTYFQQLIDRQLVLVNGKQVKKRIHLRSADEIEIQFVLSPEISLEPEEIPLDILYEDEELLVINKPAGLVVHPGAGHSSGTLVNGLLFHCKQLKAAESLRPGIVHRLDKGTSGLLVAAKNEEAQMKLSTLFANRQVHKEYLAICISNPGNRLIDQPIGRHPVRRKEMTILKERGREAQTETHSLVHNGELSLVRLIPKTGRTHQLRVHLKSIRAPILGDPVYGNHYLNKKYGLTHQLLHAEILRFVHPISGEKVEFKAPIPEDMQKIIDSIIR
ncbi:MAG: Ribosomal large subunit pseudouridine synthase D [Chlamydiae bacterium]|nr:Ribosomal large subunit pseudouridine synthase D [Chlamydiota bacterium]